MIRRLAELALDPPTMAMLGPAVALFGAYCRRSTKGTLFAYSSWSAIVAEMALLIGGLAIWACPPR